MFSVEVVSEKIIYIYVVLKGKIEEKYYGEYLI